MDASVRTTTVVKPTHVTLTMSYDEALLIWPFLGHFGLEDVKRLDGDIRALDINEAVFQMYVALDQTLRNYEQE